MLCLIPMPTSSYMVSAPHVAPVSPAGHVVIASHVDPASRDRLVSAAVSHHHAMDVARTPLAAYEAVPPHARAASTFGLRDAFDARSKDAEYRTSIDKKNHTVAAVDWSLPVETRTKLR